MHASCLQFQPRLLYIKVDSYPSILLVKSKSVNLLACMTGMIYTSCRKPSPTFLERQFTWLSGFSHTASYLSAFLGFPLTTCILMFQAPSEAVLNKSMVQALA